MRTSAPVSSPSVRWCRCGSSRTAIILLGMDGEALPRTQSVDGDDIRSWERSPRDERYVRYSLTPCVRSLLVFYTGADPMPTGSPSASVVVSELLDAIEQVAGQGVAGRDQQAHAARLRRQTFRARAPVPVRPFAARRLPASPS